MNVTICYYGAFRNKVPYGQERIETDVETLEELYEMLKKQYRFGLNIVDCLFSINDKYVNCVDYRISDNDIISFVSPMAGG